MTGRWTLYVALLIRTVIYVAMTQLIDEINGKKVADIYWNSSNTLFTSDNTNQVFIVHILDRVDIICPKYTRTVYEEFVEYSAIYMVTKDGYDKCSLDSSGVSQIVTTCRKPYADDTFALVFREFTPNPNQLEFVPGRDYYFISTSNGSNSGLWNREGGLCLHKNMRLHFSVKERRKSAYNEYKVTQTLNNNYNGNYVSQRGVDFIYDSSSSSLDSSQNRIGYSSTRNHRINSNNNVVRTPFNRRAEEQYHSAGQQGQIDYRIDPSGQLTDPNGQLTDPNGQLTKANGQLTSANGGQQRNNGVGRSGIDHRTVVNNQQLVVPGAQNSAVPPNHQSPSSSSTPEKWPWWHFQNSYAYVSFPPDSGKAHEQTPSPIRSSAKSKNSCTLLYYHYLITLIIIISRIVVFNAC